MLRSALLSSRSICSSEDRGERERLGEGRGGEGRGGEGRGGAGVEKGEVGRGRGGTRSVWGREEQEEEGSKYADRYVWVSLHYMYQTLTWTEGSSS